MHWYNILLLIQKLNIMSDNTLLIQKLNKIFYLDALTDWLESHFLDNRNNYHISSRSINSRRNLIQYLRCVLTYRNC